MESQALQTYCIWMKQSWVAGDALQDWHIDKLLVAGGVGGPVLMLGTARYGHMSIHSDCKQWVAHEGLFGYLERDGV